MDLPDRPMSRRGLRILTTQIEPSPHITERQR